MADAAPPPSGDALPERRAPYQAGEIVDGMPMAPEVVQRSVSFRQAPYPSPDELSAYERIHPGFTERILDLTERETVHRIEQERLEQRGLLDLAKRGQILAFVVVMAVVLGTIVALLTDHSVVSFAGIIVAAGALAGTFYGMRQSRQPRDDDASDLTGAGG